MLTMTDHTPPPLKFSGLVEISVQISASLSFQVDSAEFRLSTIQFPLPIVSHLNFLQKVHGDGITATPMLCYNERRKELSAYAPVIRVRISFVKAITIPPAMVSIPLERWEGSWDWRDRPTWRMP